MGDAMKKLAAAAVTAARGLAAVEEGVACAGTAVESRTYKVGGKAFVFVRAGNVMLKLGESLPQAAGKAGVKAGKGGWVTISGDEVGVTAATVGQWVKESYGLMAGEVKPAKTRKG